MIGFMFYPTVPLWRFIDSNSHRLDIIELVETIPGGVRTSISAMDYQTKLNEKTEQQERVRKEAFKVRRELPLIDMHRNVQVRNVFPNDILP